MLPRSERLHWAAATLLMIIALAGCAQTKQYTPNPSTKNYQLPCLPSNLVDVQVNDLRPETPGGDSLPNVLRSQVIAALSRDLVQQLAVRYILTIDIIEHRSFFTLGNWNASTRLRVRLVDSRGGKIGQWEALGNSHRSNMWGYATAAAVSQDAYDIAVADMMSSLSQVTIK